MIEAAAATAADASAAFSFSRNGFVAYGSLDDDANHRARRAYKPCMQSMHKCTDTALSTTNPGPWSAAFSRCRAGLDHVILT